MLGFWGSTVTQSQAACGNCMGRMAFPKLPSATQYVACENPYTDSCSNFTPWHTSAI